ncbi:hypothetical protein MYSTI_03961 [Myxococcus stipitatus DSM 14675]|uniref:Uncharacterized protein n=1 Tax=Myxococcus stipitatus (strain DSM 14675 / JCM 12634 / Mx s8) TaxID=1278073 RepID=L7UCE1_MYXSD|nr:hypothetical protein [Myxococcus stipitatus]AGC45267.1 hypothetical protein MYSTI_03961 [Myxococcus stipitatus DSM 14675]
MSFWRVLVAPLYAAFLAALVSAAFSQGRRCVASRPPRGLALWFGLLALGALWTQDVLSSEAVDRSVALALVMLSALLAVRGSRVRLSADGLGGTAPKSLDDAVAALRSGEARGWGVFQGTLDADEVLSSPGGVACAFFESEVRSVAEHGRKGALLSHERGYSPTLMLRGSHSRAHVCFSPASVMAPVCPRQCTSPPWTPLEEPSALSWERVGMPGEVCFVVGELSRGPREGTYILRGQKRRAALLVMGSELESLRTRLSRRAWLHFAAAGAMSMAAAVVLSRSM